MQSMYIIQDSNCTVAVFYNNYGQTKCEFWGQYNEKSFELKLTLDDSVVTFMLYINTSKLQDVILNNAKLGGTAYSVLKTKRELCLSICKDDLFCDAFSFLKGTCSLYSKPGIANIIFEEESQATFIGLHSVD